MSFPRKRKRFTTAQRADHPWTQVLEQQRPWIPAFAGMTNMDDLFRSSLAARELATDLVHAPVEVAGFHRGVGPELRHRCGQPLLRFEQGRQAPADAAHAGFDRLPDRLVHASL